MSNTKSSEEWEDGIIRVLLDQTGHTYGSEEIFKIVEQAIQATREETKKRNKNSILTITFSEDEHGTPQILEEWDYKEDVFNKFSSIQLGVMVLGMLEEKREKHELLLPLIAKFCEKFLAHYDSLKAQKKGIRRWE